MTPDFSSRGELTMTFWGRPGEPIPVGACPDCAAIVAVPDQPMHTRWHMRTGNAIAQAAGIVERRPL